MHINPLKIEKRQININPLNRGSINILKQCTLFSRTYISLNILNLKNLIGCTESSERQLVNGEIGEKKSDHNYQTTARRKMSIFCYLTKTGS